MAAAAAAAGHDNNRAHNRRQLRCIPWCNATGCSHLYSIRTVQRCRLQRLFFFSACSDDELSSPHSTFDAFIHCCTHNWRHHTFKVEFWLFFFLFLAQSEIKCFIRCNWGHEMFQMRLLLSRNMIRCQDKKSIFFFSRKEERILSVRPCSVCIVLLLCAFAVQHLERV